MKINSNQKTLKQLGFYSETKRRKLVAKTTESYKKSPIPSTGIPLRACGYGKGSYFDHLTLQSLTNNPTSTLGDKEDFLRPLRYKIRDATHQLKVAINFQKINQLYGLLFVPGISRQTYESLDSNPTKEIQEEFIRKAKIEGRPILAVCGGCWQLWKEYGGEVVEVMDHNYRGGMPRVKETSGKIGNNKQMHRINLLKAGSILKGAMAIDKLDTFPTVNSVHWLAPSPQKPPSELDIAALSIQDPALAPKRTYNGITKTLEPETCIEAFESKYGAPVIGVQWHPEAYSSNTPEEYFRENHIALIHYMVEAGKVFTLKKAMLEELKEKVICNDKEKYYKRFPLKTVKNKHRRLLTYIPKTKSFEFISNSKPSRIL